MHIRGTWGMGYREGGSMQTHKRLTHCTRRLERQTRERRALKKALKMTSMHAPRHLKPQLQLPEVPHRLIRVRVRVRVRKFRIA
jgi:hypothetical protein